MKRYIVQINNNKYEVFIKEPEEEISNNFNNTPVKTNQETDIKEQESVSAENNTDINKSQNNNSSVSDPDFTANNITVNTPISAKILSINKNNGDKVEKDEVIITLKVMKMETDIRAPVNGKITDITFNIGDKCKRNDKLASIVTSQ